MEFIGSKSTALGTAFSNDREATWETNWIMDFLPKANI
jgi:hypothetical protein